MEVSYSKDIYHTYMVVLGEEGMEAADEEKMMENQQAPVLLPFHIQQFNGEKNYYYDITGKMDLYTWLKKEQADLYLIRAVITFLMEIYHTIDEYLLNMDNVLLDISCIYMDMTEKQIYAAYVPGKGSSFQEQLQSLVASLLENTDHTDKDGVLLVYELYQTVRSETFSPIHLKKLLGIEQQPEVRQEVRKENKNNKENIPTEQSLNTEPETITEDDPAKEVQEGESLWRLIGVIGSCLVIFVFYKSGYLEKILLRIGFHIKAGYAAMLLLLCSIALQVIIVDKRMKLKIHKEIHEEEQDIWDEAMFENSGVYSFTDETRNFSGDECGEKTVVLSGGDGAVRLISLNRNVADDLVLTSFPCIVGNGELEGQAVIRTPGISRRHACIEKSQNDIYLMDLQSTNGTRVNGERLKKDEKRRLLVEDIIEFADVKYMFCGGGDME